MAEAKMDGGCGWERIQMDSHNSKVRDNLVVNTIGMEPNATLASDTGSEHHHTTMNKPGGQGGQL